MQPGDEQDITTSVHRNWYDLDEGRHKDEDVKDYTVEVALDAEWADFNQELLDVSVADDGQTIHVKAKKKMGGTNIPCPLSCRRSGDWSGKHLGGCFPGILCDRAAGTEIQSADR